MKQEKIKIIATVGPSSYSKSIINKMDLAGVDIFRVNLSHTCIDDLEGIINQLITWTEKTICIDTEGAQIRTGTFRENSISVKAHEIIELVDDGTTGDKSHIPLTVEDPWNILLPGSVLKIDFNSVILQVVKVEGRKVTGRILEGGIIRSNKGVCHDLDIYLPAFTSKDIHAFEIAKRVGINTVAFSFASFARDVVVLREYFDGNVVVISKIESALGLSNVDDICKESDAILIDRGDLSRDVPIEKIPFAQQYIQKKAKALSTPVYVATNLLESMVKNYKPTRAEINDIAYTLFSGADGLVLAAETTIGNYPVESVRMIVRMINEVKNKEHSGDLNYLCSLPTDRIIEPHGGELIQNYLRGFDRSLLNDIPFIEVDDEILSDVVQIAEGTFSPIKGFMTQEELESVLYEYKMPDGISWTLPILLQIEEDIAKSLPYKGTIGIKSKSDHKYYAIIKVSDKRKMNSQDKIAYEWFGTTDRNHPGVLQFFKRGEWFISGKTFLFEKPVFFGSNYSLTPSQTRNIFNDFDWHKIVGFHTRNVIHKGHEFIQIKALEKINADAIFVSPVAGKKKKGDFSLEAIITCYQTMIKNGYYRPYGVLLGTFNTYPRYSGPREAVFTAICRKNFGCSHFIVGRDHTGVGNYYSPNASQKLFDKVDTGIEILTFDKAYYCSECEDVTFQCLHSGDSIKEISGTQIREFLAKRESIPEYIMHDDISLALNNLYITNSDSVFESN
jgi:pyruvate kinase